ncbi:ferrous iron transport protein A [bacterium]|nr:ferrous iron transport protein A [bacterium]MBU1982898.1 ferrous iron transport protein A [bacterium]
MTTIDTPHTANFMAASAAVPLAEMPLGGRFRVMAVDETRESLLRLMEMGLTPGVEAVLERTAPLKTPLSIRLPGCVLAVRLDDARRIFVVPLPSSPDDPAP